MDAELGKYQSGDPDKIDKFTTVLAQLMPDQMNRYESFRHSGFQKANMRRVLQSIAGCPISIPMTIVMSGIAKMFVGELVEMGRMVMTERNESGPIRPCHIREAYRRLKLEGKVPKRSRPRLLYQLQMKCNLFVILLLQLWWQSYLKEKKYTELLQFHKGDILEKDAGIANNSAKTINASFTRFK